MDEALNFFRTYEGWIYILLLLGGLLYVRRMSASWGEMRSTIFGLERDTAQHRFNQAVTALVLIILIGVGEFVIVSYVVPLRPQANPLITPTIDLLATATATLPVVVAATEDGTPGPTPTVDARLGTCVPGSIEITSPEPGDQVRGEIAIEGSAAIENFGFYKLEVTPQSQIAWRTIQAGRKAVTAGLLVEKWETSILAPGDYLLRLVVSNTNGDALPDCQVPITILTPDQ